MHYLLVATPAGGARTRITPATEAVYPYFFGGDPVGTAVRDTAHFSTMKRIER